MELPKNVKDISGLRVGRLVVKEFSNLQNHKRYGFVTVIVGIQPFLNIDLL